RSRGRPGDLVYVTGVLGGSAAALNLLFAGRRIRPHHFQAHFSPSPRIEVGRFLMERGLASAMIDVSDGLSTDLAHICEESGVGAEVQATTIPRAIVGRPAREVDLRSALHGGDDYELLFTAARSKRVPRQIAGVPITQIGRITRGQRVLLVKPQGVAS